MQERNGVAYCASTFEKNGCPPRVICAAPVFVPASMTADDLPLEMLYDHPNFIDLISAQEFGLEQTAHDKLLLCVVAAATPEALRELLAMIVPTSALAPCASCTEAENGLHIRMEGSVLHAPAEEQAGAFTAAAYREQLPLPAMLAALTTWCTGYGCTLYWEANA